MIVIPTHLDELPSAPLSVEPFVSILRKKLKDPKTKMIRPWIKARIKQLTKLDKPKKKPKPIFANEV